MLGDSDSEETEASLSWTNDSREQKDPQRSKSSRSSEQTEERSVRESSEKSFEQPVKKRERRERDGREPKRRRGSSRRSEEQRLRLTEKDGQGKSSGEASAGPGGRAHEEDAQPIAKGAVIAMEAGAINPGSERQPEPAMAGAVNPQWPREPVMDGAVMAADRWGGRG